MARSDWIVIAALAGLAACGTQGGLAPKATPAQPAVICLPLTSYTAAQQAQAQAELQSLPANSEVGQMIADYGTMRDADRKACPTG